MKLWFTALLLVGLGFFAGWTVRRLDDPPSDAPKQAFSPMTSEGRSFLRRPDKSPDFPADIETRFSQARSQVTMRDRRQALSALVEQTTTADSPALAQLLLQMPAGKLRQ